MLENAESIIESAIASNVFPGAVLAIGRRDSVLCEKAFGLRSTSPTEEQNRLDTIYDMASVTKPFATTSAIMVLLSEGRITLEDRLSSLLNVESSKERIQLWHLLTHTSGMPPYSELWREKSGQELLDALTAVRVERPPGEKVIYSCLNFILLMRVVEEVSGVPFDDYCLKNVFLPLGLKDTRFRPELTERIAPTSVRENRVLVGEPDDELCFYLGGVSGNAGLFSTAADTLAFIIGLWTGRLVSKRVARKFTEFLVYDQDNPRRLGWQAPGPGTSSGDLFGNSAFGHTGFTGTSLWFDPETELSIVFLTNRTHIKRRETIPQMLEIRRRLHNTILAELT